MSPSTERMVEFKSDAFLIKGFLARPDGAPGPQPAVIVIQEWWGLNDHIKEIARRFAARGYVALAPDLYSRLGHQVTKDANEASQLMSQLSSQGALRDLNAAIGFLKQQPAVDARRVGAVGFCMGGTFALTMATHNSDLKAAVVFYGKVPPLETLDSLLCPVLYHHGEQDGWVTKQEVDRLRQGLRQFGKPGEVVGYPQAQHAFFNDTRPEVYRKEDAEAAWRSTIDFFTRSLR